MLLISTRSCYCVVLRNQTLTSCSRLLFGWILKGKKALVWVLELELVGTLVRVRM